MGKLFGTDGIRGVANQYPITSEMAVNIGKAAAHFFGSKNQRLPIIVGKDTRTSGDMIAYGLVSGICAMGIDACLVGTIPTPGIAFLSQSTESSAGIMISASHNPFYDNGIKFFDSRGYKLSTEVENTIEDLVLNEKIDVMSENIKDIGNVIKLNDAEDRYRRFLRRALPNDFSLRGMKIVLDCSNGATYRIAPQLFEELGVSVESLFTKPDGKNINEDCGSEHTAHLKNHVIKTGATIGLAFDGDGDRLIAIDEKGDKITGDQVLAICGNVMKQKGILENNLVVSTVMSNLGLRTALKGLGIDHFMADVGDRHVMEKMIELGGAIGGEDSGHTIFLQHHTTGDGILTGLKLVEAMAYEEKPLSELAKIMTIFPQVLINVDIKQKLDLETDPEIQKAITAVEKDLGEEGRVLVRYSGTQPLCRVMVEGPTKEKTTEFARFIADAVKLKLG